MDDCGCRGWYRYAQRWVAVVAFGRMEAGSEENLAYEELFRPSTHDGKGTRSSYAVYKRLDELSTGGEFHQAQISGAMKLSWAELRGLTLSLSYAPLAESLAFAAFEAELRRFFERFEYEGEVTLATSYWVNAGRLGEGPSEAEGVLS
jgi:hypothetical protein